MAGLLGLLGQLGQAAQKVPSEYEQAQRIKMQQQQMDEARLTDASKRLTTLMSLGTTMPSLQTSPGFQKALLEGFSGMGIDPDSLPKNAQGNFDFTSGQLSPAFMKNMTNATFMKTFQALGTDEARQQMYNAGGGLGQLPPMLSVKSYSPSAAPVPSGFFTAADSILKSVQTGGDPTSALSQMQMILDSMPDGPQKDKMMADASTALSQAASSPQAALAKATKGASYQKLLAEIANDYKTGKLDDARTALVRAQTVTEKKKPAQIEAATQLDYAHIDEASANIERSTAETAKLTTEEQTLVQQAAFNRAHGLAVNPSEVESLQRLQASLSNQVKQWDGVKAAAQKDLDTLYNSIKGDVSRKPDANGNYTLTPQEQEAATRIRSRITNANQQEYIAQKRQQALSGLTSTPNGTRSFDNGSSGGYTRGQVVHFKQGNFKYLGGDPKDHNSWVPVSGGQ